MRIPFIIRDNVIKAYDVPNIFIRNEKVKSTDFTWDNDFIKTLWELSLTTLVKNWERNPLYDEVDVLRDKLYLLELLPTDLPLELTVPIIIDDYYWERCFKARWPNISMPNLRIRYEKPNNECNVFISDQIESSEENKTGKEEDVIDKEEELQVFDPLTSYSEMIEEIHVYIKPPTEARKPTISLYMTKTWKQCFIEKFVAEEIQRMKPEVFNPEYIKDLTDLFGNYIVSLDITELKPCKNEDNCDHVSLYTLVMNLPNLIEFTVCFNKANLVDNFSWHTTKVSEADCSLLGNGVARSHIKILRILRSDVDCKKVKLLVQPLCDYTNLVILELSHCKIGDKGAGVLCGFLMRNQLVEKLILTNNKIGVEGAKAIGYYLCQEESRIIELNLKLNPLSVQGGKYIATSLARAAKSLRSLNISSCGLTPENLHFGLALKLNSTLQKLDISNNNLGQESGENLLKAIEINTTIIHFDIRMCNLPKETEVTIAEAVRKNLEKFRGTLKTPPSAVNLL